MVADPFALLTDERADSVRAALATTFGAAPIQSATFLSGGVTTARPMRVEIRDRTYLVRIEGVPSPLRNPYQYVAMRAAAEVGIAPRIHFADEETRIVITDFIVSKAHETFRGGAPAFAKALGDLSQRLQAVPSFPSFVAYPDIVARLFAHVRRTGLFTPGLLDSHVEHLHEITRRYEAGSGRLVASHNDFVPGNVLFDGTRLWLIDWESAYANDPLVDMAIAFDSFPALSQRQDVLVSAWLGAVPDARLSARLEIVRALTRLYYAGVFLSASAAAGWKHADNNLSVPSAAEFAQAIKIGSLARGSPATKHLLGKMYLAAFLDGRRPPDFAIV